MEADTRYTMGDYCDIATHAEITPLTCQIYDSNIFGLLNAMRETDNALKGLTYIEITCSGISSEMNFGKAEDLERRYQEIDRLEKEEASLIKQTKHLIDRAKRLICF